MGTTRWGFDTANQITKSVAQSATNSYGTADFWIRYLKPSGYPMTTSTAVSECQQIWDYTTSASALAFVTAPAQSRLTGTKAMGTADATTFCGQVLAVYKTVVPMYFPSGGTVYVYLDVENTTNLGLDYWNGWASYVNNYNGFSGQTLPLYAGMYCNPASATRNCSTVNNSSAAPCFAVWSTGFSGTCGKRFRSVSWSPHNCSGKTTVLWQYSIDSCQSNKVVDLDMSNPGLDAASTMFYLASRP